MVWEPREELKSSYVKKKKNFLYGEDISLLHSQDHDAGIMRRGREG